MNKKLHLQLETLHDLYNTASFIETDPIQIPHRFSKSEDIEISAFLTSIIAWGNRKSIIASSDRLMNLMDNDPYSYILSAGKNDLASLKRFVHRTFNAEDCRHTVLSLRNIYSTHGGLKKIFETQFKIFQSIPKTLEYFRDVFFKIPHPERTRKHISDVSKNSAAKRLNLFLMWMCRKDNRGVHFGLWNIPPSRLFIPLDVHCGNTGRAMGLLTRKQNDWKAVEELTQSLRRFDPADPVKYDFALFGYGVNKTISD